MCDLRLYWETPTKTLGLFEVNWEPQTSKFIQHKGCAVKMTTLCPEDMSQDECLWLASVVLADSQADFTHCHTIDEGTKKLYSIFYSYLFFTLLKLILHKINKWKLLWETSMCYFQHNVKFKLQSNCRKFQFFMWKKIALKYPFLKQFILLIFTKF